MAARRIKGNSLAVVEAGNGRLAASASGVIGAPAGDVDVFTFVSGAGAVNLTLRSDPPSGAYDSVHRPNLNLNARLYDSNGTVIASGNGVQTTSLSATVPGGRYSLEVTGSGAGAPFNSPPSGYSRYGSLGSYDVSGTFQYLHAASTRVSSTCLPLIHKTSQRTSTVSPRRIFIPAI